MASGTGALDLQLKGARPAAVLELLLLNGGRSVSTATLIDELWPDDPPKSARNSVQRFVADVRTALGEDRGLLVTTDDGYRFDVNLAETDIGRVGELRAHAEQLAEVVSTAAGEARRAALAERSRVLGEAIGLIPADLDAVVSTPAATSARRRWAEERMMLLEQRADADLALGRSAELIGELTELVEVNPYREQLCGQLMRALAAQGRQAEALRTFSRLRSRLVEELGVDPSPALRRIEMEILTGSDESAPASPTADAAMPETASRPGASALPPEEAANESSAGGAPTGGSVSGRRHRLRLIGRERQLAQLGALLAEGGVTTIVGPGGVGKTALAGAACEAAHERAVFVRLAETSSDDGVVALLVHALDIDTATTDIDQLEAEVTDALRRSPRPVVLDNAEHVTAGAARAAALLDERAGVPVLVTSREPLDIDDEAIIRLPPLTIPGSAPDGSSEAERAFIAKARRVGVEIDAEADAGAGAGDVELVAEVCRRLDGLPLALELAAAQVAHLGLADLVERLAESDDVLERRRGADRRHGSLRSLVQWSWDLLDDDERVLLRRLAEFRTRIPLELVELAGGTLRTVSALVARSLVVADRAGSSVRYSMLETIRRFVLDHGYDNADDSIAGTSHAAEVHAEAMLALVRRPPAAELARWSDTMRTITPHRPDVAAALDHLDAAGRLAEMLDVTARMAPLWSQLGPGAELQRRAARIDELVAAFEAEGGELTHQQRSEHLFITIEAAFRRLDYGTLVLSAEALVAHEATGPTDLGVLGRAFYGVLAFSAGLDPRFEQIAVQAYADAEFTEPAVLNKSHVQQWVGCCQLARFDLIAAEESFRSSLAATPRGGGIIWAELGLVASLLLQGRTVEGLRATVDIRTTPDDTAWGYVVDVMGAVLLASLGHVSEARHRLVQSHLAATSDHLLGRQDDHRIGFGIVARLAGEHDLADDLLSVPCAANPVLSAMLVYYVHRDPPTLEQWPAQWIAVIPARSVSGRAGDPPTMDMLRRWAPGIDVDAPTAEESTSAEPARGRRLPRSA